jgi:hypothetical protein
MSALQKIDNPFGGNQVATKGSAVATTDQHRAVAEVQAALLIARANPRNPVAAMDRILNACTRPTLAEGAVYTYAKGGSNVSGPSIRLAEAMAQSWGNMQFGIRELDQSNGESTVQAFAWDVETNTRREVTFQVPHVRYTRQGSKQLEDPRDIYELVANQGSRRLRACILAIIPSDVTEQAVKQCTATLETTFDVSEDSLKKMLNLFAPFEVTKEHIEKFIQRRLEAIQPAQGARLKTILQSLRDGMSVASDWFDIDANASVAKKEAVTYPQDQFDKNLPAWKKALAADKPVDDLIAMIETKFPLTEAQKATLKSKDASQATSVEASKQAEPLVASDVDGVMHTFEQIKGMLENAATLDALADAAALINSVKNLEQKVELTELYAARGEQLN